MTLTGTLLTRISAAKRAPPNTYEVDNQSSWDNLRHVGFSEKNFTRLFTEFGLPKSFPHALNYYTSLYFSSHPEIGVRNYDNLSGSPSPIP